MADLKIKIAGSSDLTGKLLLKLSADLAFQNFFSKSSIELLIFLKAPSFEQIFEWRNLQEKKLRERVGHSQNLMSKPQLARFIQHYERLTRHCLRNLPKKADVVFDLNQKHQIISCLGLD